MLRQTGLESIGRAPVPPCADSFLPWFGLALVLAGIAAGGGCIGAPGTEQWWHRRAAQDIRLVPPVPLTEEKIPDHLPTDPVHQIPVNRTGTLTLDEVHTSVEQFYPLLYAISQEQAITAGQVTAAAGAFDLNLRSRGISVPDGTYPNDRFDVLLEQPTPVYGASLFGGYRFGFGQFPAYYDDRLTADGGEFRAGVQVPLLRDGIIDRRRAALWQAELNQAIAQPVIGRARIDFFRNSARSYWAWVASGQQFFVAEELLKIARDRQSGFEEQFRRGQIAEFVVIDNRRLIVEREGLLITAERRLQQASFDLSLYLRDEMGIPIVPSANRLPVDFLELQPPKPQTDQLREYTLEAIAIRPELERFRLQKQREAVDLRLAENQLMPGLNAAVAGTEDVGNGKKTLDRESVELSLLLDVPLQRREALGRTQVSRARLAQLTAQEQYARDQIVVEVQDAVSALDRTFARIDVARQELAVTRRVAAMEFERFQAGQSTLLDVNLREIAAASAEAKVIDALAEYYRAEADFRAALGIDAITPVQTGAAPAP